MELYDEEGNKTIFNLDNKIGNGSYSNVYLLPDNKCLKVFNWPNLINAPEEFSGDVFNIIKELNLKNFIKLYDLYYNQSLTEILGYTSKYYKPEEIDILTTPTEYTLDNLFNMYLSISKLSESGIVMFDVHDNNVIMGEKKITIIDCDLYFKAEDRCEIFKANMYSLFDLFTTLYLKSLEKYNVDDKIMMSSKIERLFIHDSAFGVENVTRKLVKYKYPIDYLKKK